MWVTRIVDDVERFMKRFFYRFDGNFVDVPKYPTLKCSFSVKYCIKKENSGYAFKKIGRNYSAIMLFVKKNRTLS